MKIYIEIIEILSDEDLLTKLPKEVRVEVISEIEAMEKFSQLEALFIGKKYIKQIHFCGHEDGNPCEIRKV